MRLGCLPCCCHRRPMLMGYYGMLAFCVNTFDGDLPADRSEALLPV